MSTINANSFAHARATQRNDNQEIARVLARRRRGSSISAHAAATNVARMHDLASARQSTRAQAAPAAGAAGAGGAAVTAVRTFLAIRRALTLIKLGYKFGSSLTHVANSQIHMAQGFRALLKGDKQKAAEAFIKSAKELQTAGREFVDTLKETGEAIIDPVKDLVRDAKHLYRAGVALKNGHYREAAGEIGSMIKDNVTEVIDEAKSSWNHFTHLAGDLGHTLKLVVSDGFSQLKDLKELLSGSAIKLPSWARRLIGFPLPPVLPQPMDILDVGSRAVDFAEDRVDDAQDIVEDVGSAGRSVYDNTLGRLPGF